MIESFDSTIYIYSAWIYFFVILYHLYIIKFLYLIIPEVDSFRSTKINKKPKIIPHFPFVPAVHELFKKRSTGLTSVSQYVSSED